MILQQYTMQMYLFTIRIRSNLGQEVWDPNLKKSKVKVLEASEGMTLDRVPGLEDVEAGDGVDEKTLYDPHTWLDPEKVGEEAQIIADKLSEVDSEHKETYQKNAQAFIKKSSRID